MLTLFIHGYELMGTEHESVPANGHGKPKEDCECHGKHKEDCEGEGRGRVGWSRSWTRILTGGSKYSSFCFTESRLSSGSYAINFRFRTVFYVTFAFFYLDNKEEIKYGHEKVPFTTEFRYNEYEFGSDGITIRGYIYDIESGDEGAFLRVSLNKTIISTVHCPLSLWRQLSTIWDNAELLN